MHRYFGKIINEEIILSKEDIHHLLHVLRCKKNDEIEVVDNSLVYLGRIISTNPIKIICLHQKSSDCELNKKVVLFFPLAKGGKIDLVIQKASELGVGKIVLFSSKRCVKDFLNKDINKKLERYNKIAKEASEQCHRNKIAQVVGIYDINNIPKELLCELNLLAYEAEAGKTDLSFKNIKKAKDISVIIGPEGGFEKEEINKLINDGFTTISLGKRILRCETAAIYSLSVISYLLEKENE